MPEAFWNTQRQRTKVLGLARNLARSGRHENHHSILPELEARGGFRSCASLSDRPSHLYALDRLCTMAQASAPAGVPISPSFSPTRDRRHGATWCAARDRDVSEFRIEVIDGLAEPPRLRLKSRPERSCWVGGRHWRGHCMRSAMQMGIPETS